MTVNITTTPSIRSRTAPITHVYRVPVVRELPAPVEPRDRSTW